MEKRAWKPPREQWRNDTPVALHVAAQEREVRRNTKAIGGKRNSQDTVRELLYGQMVALGLTERIVATTEGGERPPIYE